ncbi:MAG: hypothetical protein JST89_23465 [Cyanobacteria bacterium SZAS-4]|nr:hypothetical protein [Cyanobacteria bacterium SZAS-4]
METAAPHSYPKANSSSTIFGQNQLLTFDMNREQVLQMIKSVLKELNAHIKEFGDKILCILREESLTYAFELNIESKPTSSSVRVENFRVVNSFSELVELRFQLQSLSYR